MYTLKALWKKNSKCVKSVPNLTHFEIYVPAWLGVLFCQSCVLPAVFFNFLCDTLKHYWCIVVPIWYWIEIILINIEAKFKCRNFISSIFFFRNVTVNEWFKLKSCFSQTQWKCWIIFIELQNIRDDTWVLSKDLNI